MPPLQPEASSPDPSAAGTRNTTAGTTYSTIDARPSTAVAGAEPRSPTDPRIRSAIATQLTLALAPRRARARPASVRRSGLSGVRVISGGRPTIQALWRAILRNQPTARILTNRRRRRGVSGLDVT